LIRSGAFQNLLRGGNPPHGSIAGKSAARDAAAYKDINSDSVNVFICGGDAGNALGRFWVRHSADMNNHAVVMIIAPTVRIAIASGRKDDGHELGRHRELARRTAFRL
jgi:hypothetical protein